MTITKSIQCWLRKTNKWLANLAQALSKFLKDAQMKRIYEHTIPRSSNECVFLNTSLGRKYYPVLEGDSGGNNNT